MNLVLNIIVILLTFCNISAIVVVAFALGQQQQRLKGWFRQEFEMKALHVPHILPTFNIYTASQNNEVLVHNNNNNNNNIETVFERCIH